MTGPGHRDATPRERRGVAERPRGPSRRSTDSRVVGVDTARGIALIGMFVAHVAPAAASAAGAEWIALADERPRLLFALAAGIGVGLLTGGSRPTPTGRGDIRRQIAIRAVILIALGLVVIEYLRPLVFVILDVYGVAFLVLLPLLFVPPRAALALGGALTLVMPGLVEWAAPPVDAIVTGAVPHLVADWFLTGAYPVVIWVPVMLIGLGIARLDVTAPAVVRGVALVGAIVACTGLPISRALAGAAAPSTSADDWSAPVRASLEVAGNVGVGLLVVSACVALMTLARPSVRRTWSAASSPIAAMGAMPLTIYTLHLVVIASAKHMVDGVATDDSWPLLIGLVVGSMAFAWTWQRLVGRGPLEMLMRAASGRDRAGGTPVP